MLLVLLAVACIAQRAAARGVAAAARHAAPARGVGGARARSPSRCSYSACSPAAPRGGMPSPTSPRTGWRRGSSGPTGRIPGVGLLALGGALNLHGDRGQRRRDADQRLGRARRGAGAHRRVRQLGDARTPAPAVARRHHPRAAAAGPQQRAERRRPADLRRRAGAAAEDVRRPARRRVCRAACPSPCHSSARWARRLAASGSGRRRPSRWRSACGRTTTRSSPRASASGAARRRCRAVTTTGSCSTASACRTRARACSPRACAGRRGWWIRARGRGPTRAGRASRAARPRRCCELHVGTFTRRGDVRRGDRAARARCATSASPAIELLPVAAFPGERGWGYDGVYPWSAQAPTAAPTGCSGSSTPRTRAASR